MYWTMAGGPMGRTRNRKKVNAKCNPLRLLVDYLEFPFKSAQILKCWALGVMVLFGPMPLLLFFFFFFSLMYWTMAGGPHGPPKKTKKGK